MNVKELTQLLNLVKGIIDQEEVEVCIDDSRDGYRSFVEANVRFAKDRDGVTVLAVGYK